MRIPAIVLVCCGAVVGTPVAFPGECDSCKDLPKTKDIGECGLCRGMTTSGSFRICMDCSRRRGECQRCRKAVAPPPAETIDESRDGKYASGPWEYAFSITGRGTRSEGRHGRLLHAGRPVPEPEGINDHHRTPWGPLYWVGRPAVPFGGHGWMPRPRASRPVGDLLPEPKPEPAKLTVWVKVLAAGAPGEMPIEEPWIREGLEREGVRDARVEKDWFSLGSENALLHDTKMYGRASIRLCPSGEGEPLAVTTWNFDREGTRTEIPRQDGATELFKHSVSSCVDVLDLYLAVRVGPPPAPKETSWVDDLLEEPAGPGRGDQDPAGRVETIPPRRTRTAPGNETRNEPAS